LGRNNIPRRYDTIGGISMANLSARGEFGPLLEGLNQVKKEMTNIMGVINSGARKGGIFDDSQVRALELFKKRFKDLSRDVSHEFKNQEDAVDQLYQRMNNASQQYQNKISKEIALRQQNINLLYREFFEARKLFDLRTQEASQYSRINAGSSGGSFYRTQGGSVRYRSSSGGPNPYHNYNNPNRPPSAGFFGNGSANISSLLTQMLIGAGNTTLGLAGITGIGGVLHAGYSNAYNRQVGSLDLAQRIRGSQYGGSAAKIYDKVSATGRIGGLGYTPQESWAMQQSYTMRAGILSDEQQYRMQKFSRSYGLQGDQTAAIMGQAMQVGATVTPRQFADMIAGSVEKSGMSPRILEVMDASVGLLTNLSTSLKAGDNRSILGYQTILDKVGTENNMPGLTGAQGASVVAGLAGPFQAGNYNSPWKWMGIRGMMSMNPEKYGKMDIYSILKASEEGLSNPDNVSGLASHLNNNIKDKGTRMVALRSWLQQGGKNYTLGQTEQLYDSTNGLQDFTKISSVTKQIESADSGSKFEENRKSDFGQQVLNTDADFKDALGKAGEPLLETVTGIKTAFAGLVISSNTLEEAFGKLAASNLGVDINTPEGGLMAQAAGKATGFAEQHPFLATGLGIGAFYGVKKLATKGISALKAGNVGGSSVSRMLGWAPGLGGLLSTGIAKLEGDSTGRSLMRGAGTAVGGYAGAMVPVPGFNLAASMGGAYIGNKVGGGVYDAGKWVANKIGDFFGASPAHAAELDSPKREIQKFRSENTDTLSRFKQKGTEELKRFQEYSSESMKKLSDSGDNSFTKLKDNVSTIMDKVYNEHRGIKEYIGDLWGRVDGTPSISGSNIGSGNRTLNKNYGKYSSLIEKYGNQFNIDPNLIAQVIQAESSFNPSATSHAGAMGLMQLMPGTAKSLGVTNAYDPEQNIMGGSKYLRQQLDAFGGDVGMALAAYNAGPGNASKWGKTWSQAQGNAFSETKKYVNGILSNYNAGSASFPVGNSSVLNGQLLNPVSGAKIPDGQWLAGRASTGRHYGIDLFANQGTPIQSTTAGTVSNVGWNKIGGWRAGITDAEGNYHYYAHMMNDPSKFLQKGQRVEAGQTIGYVGDTGDAKGTPYHLHYGIQTPNRNNGTEGWINPYPFLEKFNRNPTSTPSNTPANSPLPKLGPAFSGGLYSNAVQHSLDVNVNLGGEGANNLSNMDLATIKDLIANITNKAVKGYLDTMNSVNPTVLGW